MNVGCKGVYISWTCYHDVKQNQNIFIYISRSLLVLAFCRSQGKHILVCDKISYTCPTLNRDTGNREAVSLIVRCSVYWTGAFMHQTE